MVWLAVAQIFVSSLLASSPELHEHFHPDSHESGHHCLATDLQSGTLELSAIIPIVAPVPTPVAIRIETVSAEVRRSLPIHLCGSLLEHGPPVRA